MNGKKDGVNGERRNERKRQKWTERGRMNGKERNERKINGMNGKGQGGQRETE